MIDETMRDQIHSSILTAVEAQTRVLHALTENIRLLSLLSEENWGLEEIKRDLATALKNEGDDGKEDGTTD